MFQTQFLYQVKVTCTYGHKGPSISTVCEKVGKLQTDRVFKSRCALGSTQTASVQYCLQSSPKAKQVLSLISRSFDFQLQLRWVHLEIGYAWLRNSFIHFISFFLTKKGHYCQTHPYDSMFQYVPIHTICISLVYKFPFILFHIIWYSHGRLNHMIHTSP